MLVVRQQSRSSTQLESSDEACGGCDDGVTTAGCCCIGVTLEWQQIAAALNWTLLNVRSYCDVSWSSSGLVSSCGDGGDETVTWRTVVVTYRATTRRVEIVEICPSLLHVLSWDLRTGYPDVILITGCVCVRGPFWRFDAQARPSSYRETQNYIFYIYISVIFPVLGKSVKLKLSKTRDLY